MRILTSFAAIALIGMSVAGCQTMGDQMGEIAALPHVQSDPNISAASKEAINRCANKRFGSGLLGIVSPLASIGASAASANSDDCATADHEYQKYKQRQAKAG